MKPSEAPLFPDREFPFSPQEFREIAEALRSDAGIALSEGKAPLVYSRLVKRLRALGLKNFKEYCEIISADGASERTQMISALTTNVTRFFREPHHFEHLKTKVLPRLLKDARQGGRVRIWSAGCSSGEEPYSIALTLLSMMPEAPRFDIKILATDIDKEILRRAREGVYGDSAVEPIAPQQRQRWFASAAKPSGETCWQVGDEMRALVSFRTLNLLDPWPMKGKFQAVFCRNVVIYFEDDVRNQLWPRLAGALLPGGVLYLGHSERASEADHLFRVSGLTTYELRERPELEFCIVSRGALMPAAADLQVLIADDQRMMRELVRSVLADLGCRQVVECPDGTYVMRALELRPAHLIISDLNMPNMDGLELLRAVRAHPTRSKTAFIMLTSRAEKEMVRTAIDLGVNNYVVKPFTAGTLKGKIEAVLGTLT